MAEMYTVKDLAQASNPASTGAKASTQLKEWNEILKTVNSIAQNVGIDLRQLTKKEEPQPMPQNNATKIESGINKAISTIPNTQEQQQAPATPQKVTLDTKQAGIDLMQWVENDEKMKQAQEFIKALNDEGKLQEFLANALNKYVRLE